MAKITKFINDPKNLVQESLEGYVKAFSDRIALAESARVVIRKNKPSNKVGVLIGNGAGHEPACIGFVGKNMLDANAVGALFAAPDPYTILAAIKEADCGKGVCVLISNHAGDILNSKMAIDMAEDDEFNVKGVVLYDDIASAPPEEIEERRGTAGTMFAYKIVGTYAEGNHSLEDV